MASTIPFEDALLKLLFNATPVPKLADNATLTPAAQLYVSLHTEDPAKSPLPLQTSAEVAYTGYARMPVPRTTDGWEVDQGKAMPAEIIEFPEVSGVTGTARVAAFFGVGIALTGGVEGDLMFSGKLNPAITLSNGVEPRIDNQSAASRFEETWA